MLPQLAHAGYDTLYINWFPLGQNDRYFPDGIFGCIFVDEKFCILIKISMKFVSNGSIDNNPALI